MIEDICAQLGAELVTRRGPLARESLELSMLETSSQPERLSWLAQVVPGLSGSGVIYVLTIVDTTRVASFLRTEGIDAHAYSGETEPERRLELEDALIANEVKALVATSALGMGFRTRRSCSRGARRPRHPGLLHRLGIPVAGEGRRRDR